MSDNAHPMNQRANLLAYTVGKHFGYHLTKYNISQDWVYLHYVKIDNNLDIKVYKFPIHLSLDRFREEMKISFIYNKMMN